MNHSKKIKPSFLNKINPLINEEFKTMISGLEMIMKSFETGDRELFKKGTLIHDEALKRMNELLPF